MAQLTRKTVTVVLIFEVPRWKNRRQHVPHSKNRRIHIYTFALLRTNPGATVVARVCFIPTENPRLTRVPSRSHFRPFHSDRDSLRRQANLLYVYANAPRFVGYFVLRFRGPQRRLPTSFSPVLVVSINLITFGCE